MNLQHWQGLSCPRCERTVRDAQICPHCGGTLDHVLDTRAIAADWSREELARDPDPSLWRYLPLLPLKKAPRHRGIQVGGTPLIPYPELATELGLAELWIKDDTRNPSSSLKDRATELALAQAREEEADVIIAASTGNAGASLACLAAYHGQRAVLVVPADAPPAKLVQIRQHGAFLLPVAANYDRAFDLAAELAAKHGWYCRNTATNPILAEGKKTAALEIAEQLQWNAPDAVLVPVGDGCILHGVYRGFEDLVGLGWLKKMPRLLAIQAAGSAAVVRSLGQEAPIAPVEARTVADSISVDLPRDGEQARRAVKLSAGQGVTVSDANILAGQRELSRRTGLFAEPAAAITWAGLQQLVRGGAFTEKDRIVLLLTGSGLKDIEHARSGFSPLRGLDPEVDRLELELTTGGLL